MSERAFETNDPDNPQTAPTSVFPQTPAQTSPTMRIDIDEHIEEEPATVPLPPRPAEPAPASYPPAEPPIDDGNGGGDAGDNNKPRKKWPIITAIIVAVALVAGICGAIVYSNKHAEALVRCRAAVADFSDARKRLVNTTKNLSAVQRWALDTLGVDGMIDAVAKAAGAAEGTVSTEGCATNATITQLNLVADTVTSATTSLNESVNDITKQQKEQDNLLNGSDWKKKALEFINGSPNADSSADTKDDSASDDANNDVDNAKRGFRDSLEHAKGLLSSFKQQYGDSAAGKKISEGLQSAIDAAEKLDLSPITNSRIYKAGKATLDEAISVVNNWIDTQAAKAK